MVESNNVKFTIDKKLYERIGNDLLKELGVIEVGIFDAKNYKTPHPTKKKKFGTGIARATSNKVLPLTTADILKKNDEQYKVFSRPFERKDKNYDDMINAIIDHKLYKVKQINKIKNAVKGMFIKPILAGLYGKNSQKTAEIKGFNKLLIDTGQTMNAIGVKLGIERIK